MTRLLAAITTAIVSITLFSLVLPTAQASATDVFGACQSAAAGSTDVCQPVNNTSNGNPILKILKTVISVISYIIGIAAVIVILVAGLQMVIGGDNPKTVETARNMIIYALVGVVVAVLAQSIVVFVLKNVG